MRNVIQDVLRNILSITTDIVLMFGLWCCKMSYMLHLKAMDLCVRGGNNMNAFKHEISVRTKLLDDNTLQLVIIDHDTMESWFNNIRFRETKKVSVQKVESDSTQVTEEKSSTVMKSETAKEEKSSEVKANDESSD